MLFDFTTPKHLKITPNDEKIPREKQENEDKKVE